MIIRHINWHQYYCQTYSEKKPTLSDPWFDEAEDTLLFNMALRGRVPISKPRRHFAENMYGFGFMLTCNALGYYVGRSKAMKAYKTKNYKKYYAPKSSFISLYFLY